MLRTQLFRRSQTHISIPSFPHGTSIPKIIHQTYPTKHLPPELDGVVRELRSNNPGWDYRFYDDKDIEAYIAQNYGPDILGYYRRLNPTYGAARADLFRYLLMYKEGGVYLDIKSSAAKPLDEILTPDDRFLLSGWANQKGQKYATWGLHKELESLEGGEFQQWHIVCAPGSPFLRAVIQAVLANIDNYRPWRQGVGLMGVLRTTGPIAYTLAIAPLLAKSPHRYARTNDELGLIYAATEGSHKKFFRNNYEEQTESVVKQEGLSVVWEWLYLFYIRHYDFSDAP